MVSRFFRKLISPITRMTPVKNAMQKKAIKKIDAIERGEVKMMAPKYPGEKQLLNRRTPLVDENIKKELETKDESLLSNIDKITITSEDSPEIPQSKRDLPKRLEEYYQQDQEEYEYGFYEPPEEKIDKNRLMFREALELIRDRMRTAVETNQHDIPLFDQSTSRYIETHPASKRVDHERLERVWSYFRPFADKMDQKLTSKVDLKIIQEYIEGHGIQHAEIGRASMLRRLAQSAQPQQLQHKFDAQQMTQAEREDLEAAVKERHEKEMKRLEKRLEELEELEKEVKDQKK